MQKKILSPFLFIAIILSIPGCLTLPEAVSTGPKVTSSDTVSTISPTPFEFIQIKPYACEISRVFNSDFETTWSAIIKILEAHPILTIEKQSGILVTDWVEACTPLYTLKNSIPVAKKDTKKSIGIFASPFTPNLIMLISIPEDGPAYSTGVRSGDVLLDWNGEKISNASDYLRLSGTISDKPVVLRVLRYDKKEPLIFTITPREYTHAYEYGSARTRYKLNIRASKVDSKTEVKIINYDETDLGHYAGGVWIPNVRATETSTLREKVLLDLIELEIKSAVARSQS